MTSPRTSANRWLLGLGVWAAAALPAPALATEALPDPTRPPAVPESAPQGTAPAKPAGSGLQTVIRRVGARPAAIINGEYVELGAKVGEAKLIQIGEDSVILQGPAGREVLKLTPSAGKEAPMAEKKKKNVGPSPAPHQQKTEARK